MKNFEIFVIVFIILMSFICYVLFSEENLIRQNSIHFRDKVVEVLDIHGGYTLEAKQEIDKLIENSNYEVDVSFSKSGKLDYREKITFTITYYNESSLPFLNSTNNKKSFSINGEYFNLN